MEGHIFAKYFLLLTVLTTWKATDSERILSLIPTPSKSHDVLVMPLVQELARRGHNVTYVTPFPSSADKNYREVGIEEHVDKYEVDFFKISSLPVFQMINLINHFVFERSDDLLSNPNIQELLHGDEKFDLILSESMLHDSATAAFSHKHKAPVVNIATFMPNYFSNFMVGNVAPVSFVPDPALNFAPPMTFFQRVLNFLAVLAAQLFHSLIYLPKQDAIMRKHVGEDCPTIGEIIKNTSLVLVNHHFSLAFARPYAPNMVEVGGMHVLPPKKLPQDIQEYLDNSKDGAIIVSFGTNAKTTSLSKDNLQEFLNAFGRIKAKFLWKWDDDYLEGKPDNVKSIKWLPQSDVLAHRNVKLFMTHGGLLSMTEAVIREVPIIGMPLFADQPFNMVQAEAMGIGRVLDWKNVTADYIVDIINDVLYNPRYREAMKNKSFQLKDNPLTPLERAVYWIEYVIRHKGAPHMRSHAQDLNWFQLYSIDIVAFISSCLISIVFFIVFLFKVILRLFSRKRLNVQVRKKVD